MDPPQPSGSASSGPIFARNAAHPYVTRRPSYAGGLQATPRGESRCSNVSPIAEAERRGDTAMVETLTLEKMKVDRALREM